MINFPCGGAIPKERCSPNGLAPGLEARTFTAGYVAPECADLVVIDPSCLREESLEAWAVSEAFRPCR